MNPGANLTQYLYAYDFDFVIPGGAEIHGIVVKITKSCTLGTYVDSHVWLTDNGGAGTGTDQAAAGSWAIGATEYTYGTKYDKWGQITTVAEANSAAFGVMLQAACTGYDTATVSVVSITIYYSD